MKTLLLLLALASTSAFAKDFPVDKCADSYPLEYYVVAKHPGGLIELDSPILGRALVKTKRGTFKEGALNISFKYKKMKTLLLSNGFTAEVRLWEECK